MTLNKSPLPGEREMLVAWLDRQTRSGRSWVALSEIDYVGEGIRFAMEHSPELIQGFIQRLQKATDHDDHPPAARA